MFSKPKPKRTRDLTASFLHTPETFLDKQVVVPNFAKGISDNYAFQHDPNRRTKVEERDRSALGKLLGVGQTRMMAPDVQRKLALNEAATAISESGLKTHFFSVMQDGQRKGVANLTPDIEAYRSKLARKQKQYLEESKPDKRKKRDDKLAALQGIVKAFAGFQALDRENDGPVMQAGYFPYRQDQPGATDLHSRKNASGRWVFTGAMNGCAIAVQNVMDLRTESANNVSPEARAYHFPSPASNDRMLTQWLPEKKLSGWFGSAAYGDTENVDAFNALHVKGSDIALYSQRHRRALLDQGDLSVEAVNVFDGGTERLDNTTTVLKDRNQSYGWKRR